MSTAIYARISQDTAGNEVGVERQIKDATRLAKDRGWTDVVTFSDNDLSAYSGAKRPGYLNLMQAVEVGDVKRIVVYQTSRLWRSRRERADAIELLKDRRVPVVAVSGPELDLSTANGRMIAGILGEFDEAESAVKGERVASAAQARAERGYASGGVAYGWRRVEGYKDGADPRLDPAWHDVEDAEQAGVVREIVDRLLAGDTLRGIADALNERGIPTPSGKPGVAWRHTTIRKLAVRPANVGKRVHRGEVIGDAEWPAIVDSAKHARVCALLKAPERRKTNDASRKHLLTYGDVGACGVCGAVLRVAVKNRNATYGKPAVLYVCDDNGCVGRSQENVDELASAAIVVRLQQDDIASVFATDDAAMSEAMGAAEAARTRLNEAAEQFADGVIDGEQLAKITGRLRPELDRAESEVRRLTPHGLDLPASLLGERAQATWEALDVVRRRKVAEALGLHVTINRTRRGPGFRPEDVDVRFA